MATGDGSPTSGGSGDIVATEDTFTATQTGISGVKVAVGKIRIGSNDRDDGDVKAGNPFPVHDWLNDQYAQQLVALAQATLQQLQSMLDVQPRPIQAKNAQVSTVIGVTTSTQIAPANVSRKALAIFNDTTSSGNLYLLFAPPGTKASATAGGYTVRLAPGDYYEVPAAYVGAVQGVWDSVTTPGWANVTDLS